MRVIDLKQDMDARFSDLQQDVDARFSDLKQDVGARFNDLKQDMDSRFVQVDQRFLEMDARIANEGATTRRHFDIVAEQLRADVALVLAAQVGMNERLDRHIAESRSEHATFVRALDNHEVRLIVLERPERKP